MASLPLSRNEPVTMSGKDLLTDIAAVLGREHFADPVWVRGIRMSRAEARQMERGLLLDRKQRGGR